MQEGVSRPRLAVLIDGENMSPRLAEAVFREVRRIGDPGRAAGLWGLQGAGERLERGGCAHALEPRHCFAPAAGKNGADILLAIDATRLLLGGGLDGLCIASSDGDFAEVALSIRREGRRAYGFGRDGVKERLRLAFDEYVAVAPAPVARSWRSGRTRRSRRCARPWRRSRAGGGWYCLGEFGTHAQRAGIDPKRHGVTKLSELLRATGQFEVETGTPPGRFRPVTLRAVGEA
jgi:hypothetical protein